MKQKLFRKGFTLIEMLIVIAIIGILASIVLIGLGPVQQQGRDARRQADLHEVQNALELYYNKCGHYPGTSDCTAAPGDGQISWSDVTAAITGSGIGISQIPVDPVPSNTYRYATNAGGTAYVLEADLERPRNTSLGVTSVPPSIQSPGDINCAGQQYCISL